MPPHPAYTAFMILALLVFLLARRLAPVPRALAALLWWQRLTLGLTAFVGGALGAKLPFVFGRGEGWLTEAAWISDGKTITTGLIGAYLAVELTKLALGVRVKTGDTFALPLALALGSGAELLQPLAIAVIGGLMIALLLSLIVTPTVYAMLNRKRA